MGEAKLGPKAEHKITMEVLKLLEEMVGVELKAAEKVVSAVFVAIRGRRRVPVGSVGLGAAPPRGLRGQPCVRVCVLINNNMFFKFDLLKL